MFSNKILILNKCVYYTKYISPFGKDFHRNYIDYRLRYYIGIRYKIYRTRKFQTLLSTLYTAKSMEGNTLHISTKYNKPM